MGNSTSNQNSESEQEDVEVCMNLNELLQMENVFSDLTFLSLKLGLKFLQGSLSTPAPTCIDSFFRMI